MFNIGDKVIKNPKKWLPNDFDKWGRGQGVGIVVEPPFTIDNIDYVDVRWESGRCFEKISGLQLFNESNA